MRITAVVLVFNEELHIARCLSSIREIASDIVIIDCFSTDRTVEIAQSFGAKIFQHKWVGHSAQFNWALLQLDSSTEWVLRIDADEILSQELIHEINHRMPTLDKSINGVYFGRRMKFQGRLIKHGGLFPIRILRLFRFGFGKCEKRCMDEHIIVSGGTFELEGEIIDDNLHSLNWWITKHNKYSNLEVVDLLNLEFKFMELESLATFSNKGPGFKRWLKESIYVHAPLGYRAFAYFIYRYIFRFGFLDGTWGSAFHLLQGFWYRYLVDLKVLEVKHFMRTNNVGIEQAIFSVLNIDVSIYSKIKD